MYVKSRQACHELGIESGTLRRWALQGYINTIKTDSGHNLYDIDGYKRDHQDKYQQKQEENKPMLNKRKVLYCRVSSNKQKEDLERQVEFLSGKYKEHEVCKEIASGINFKRKILYRLLEQAFKGELEEIVVAHRDRLCRLAWDHFQWLFNRLGVRLIVDSEEEKDASPGEQLADDLMSIIHVFSSRHYGIRSQRANKRASASKKKTTSKTGIYAGEAPKEGSEKDSSE